MNLLKKSFRLLSLAVAVLAMAVVLGGGSYASALSGSEFNAGRIIDDAVFFNPNTMGAGDIQAFLNSKVPNCDTNGSQPHSSGVSRAAYGASRGYPAPYTCLKDFFQSIPSKSADAYCTGSITGGYKSAAGIITDVAQACGVNPKVLIILLQKEQSLVTDDWPWSIQYRSATGYGCPDTAPCDSEYYGFFNQVYNAARQFQRYAKQPQLFNYRGGVTSYVQYNPNAACGGSNLHISNQATAGLYNYTPYQPNQAALNNLYGTGDGCSAYGNRNFWRLYNDWFGPTFTTAPWAWSYEGQWAYSDSARTREFTGVATTTPGGTIYVRFKARNIGTQTWNRSFTNVGTTRAMDRSSQFENGTWLNPARPARLVENSVAPGGIGTFEFSMQAPNTTGTYNEYFGIVAEGISWLNDLGLFYTVNVNNAVGPSNSINTTLESGQSLWKNDYLLSPDSQTVLTLQQNSDLLMYSNMKSIWHTVSEGSGADRLVMQTDGNLVLYGPGRVVWASGTDGNPGARLVLQTDGNMVIYSASNTPLWATYTISNPDHLSYVNTTFEVGRIYPGQTLDTANRRFKLIMQRDGNLVLYSPNRATWASGTDGRDVAFAAMQSDGNVVIYEKSGRPIWYTGTAGNGRVRLLLQQDGNLVAYNAFNRPLWHTVTAGVE